MTLRTLLEWDIARRLQTVPGVVEVNIWGGETKQFQVVVDPGKLLSHSILRSNRSFMHLNRIMHWPEVAILNMSASNTSSKGEAMATNVTDLSQIVIDHGPGGVPIFVKDIGESERRGGITPWCRHKNGRERNSHRDGADAGRREPLNTWFHV